MERAGTSNNGTITAIYTVLVDGGDFDEPIADAARGILDGHILLSRDLAAKIITHALILVTVLVDYFLLFVVKNIKNQQDDFEKF